MVQCHELKAVLGAKIMIDLRNKKTKKTISTVIVVILALAMVIPTLVWAIK